MDGDRKLVHTILERLCTRLPIRTGDDLSDVRRNEVVAMSRMTLIEAAKMNIENVISCILHQLEIISRNYENVAPRSRPLLVLLSQTYLVDLMAECTGSHWDAYDAMTRERRAQEEMNEPDAREFVPRRSRSREADPPPLNDDLAQYTMETLLRLTNNNLDDHSSIGSGKAGMNMGHADERSLDGYSRKSTDLEKTAFKVIEYISATNWPLVYQILRNKLKYLRTTAAEDGDASGLQFMSHLSLNQKKLSLVIQEVSGSFLPLRKASQNTLASLLPEAIHRWIDSHPNDFIDLHLTQQRLDPGAETLFDFAVGLSDAAKRRAVLWPLQTALVLLLPEVFIQADANSTGPRGSALAKKLVFLNNLRQALKVPRSAEIAASCLITILRAGSLFPSDSDSALLSFAYDIQNDVREEIFKKSIHGHLDEFAVERDILIKAVVGLCRISVESVVEHLLPRCFANDAPLAFKTTIFGAGAVLATQPNYDDYAPFWKAIAPELRESLQIIASTRPLAGNAHIGLQLPSGEVCLNRSAYRANISTESIDTVGLLYQILELLKIRPFLIYENEKPWNLTDPQAFEYERDNVMNAILRLIYDEDEFIRNSTVLFTKKLMTRESFEWFISSPAMTQNEALIGQVFWFTSSALLFTLSQRLLEFDPRDPGLKTLLSLLHDYLEARASVIEYRKGFQIGDLTIGVSDMQERISANAALERAFLVLLCHIDLEICSMTTHCIALLCEEGRAIVESLEEHPGTASNVMRNFAVYSELSLQHFKIIGPVAFQTRLRKLLTRMSNPSKGIIMAWETVFYRWEFFGHDMLSPGFAATGQVDDKMLMEWRNYSGFLASVGGVCIADVPSHIASGLRAADPAMAGAKWIDRVHMEGDTMSLLEKFMTHCLKLLVCNLARVRETIRHVLGTELNPRLYLQLFRSLETELNVVLDSTKDGPMHEETRTLFTEQVCALLKTIVDRLEETQDTFLAIDLGAMTLSLARFLQNLRDNGTILRVKIRMCNLVELVARKKQIINLRQDLKVRNQLLQILSEWMAPAMNGDTMRPVVLFKRDDMLRLQRDLDRACLRAMVNLLDRLPLQPLEPSNDVDMFDARSNMFIFFFNTFMALLDQGQPTEGRRTETQTASLVRDDAESFRGLAIQALSNLLSANVDIGLKYSLEIGYHESVSTRTAFMVVLTNILTQGTEFGSLGDSTISEKYEQLTDILVNDRKFALALCEHCPSSEVDELTTALLNIFESRGVGLVLLRDLIQQEVDRTDNEADLLRRNCVATKMLSVYAKWKGSDYLHTVLHDILERLVTSSNDLDLEMDPKRGGLSDEELERNGQELRHCAKVFIDEITSSADIVPETFKSICHCIATCVTAKFPEAKYTAVGAFIFLRFFCPAIVSPDTEGLISSPLTKEMRRGLMLIAKIIQGLANNVLFVAKESYMIPLNDFLTGNICQVIQFLRDISVPPKKSQEKMPLETFDFGSRVALHRFLFDHWETIRHKLLFEEKAKLQLQVSEILNGAVMKSSAELPTLEIEQSIKEFSSIVHSLGQPPLDISLGPLQMGVAITPAYSRYQQFMLKHSGRSIEDILAKRIVYEGGETLDGLPVMCFVQRNINPDKIDPELLTYCFLKVLSRMMHKPFAILVDATMHSVANELPDDVCLTARNLMPPEMIKNYKRLYVYNMNSAYRKFFKKSLKTIERSKSPPIVWGQRGIDLILVTSMQDLQQHFSLGAVNLSKETMNCLGDSKFIYSQVKKLTKQSSRQPLDVIVKIGPQYLQITPTQPRELIPGYALMVTTNDIYRISELEDNGSSPWQDNENSFALTAKRAKTMLYFSSPQKTEILKELKRLKDKSSRDVGVDEKSERMMRPEDVPGTMLNISLLNMGSTDPNLRLAAYNLFCAMCEAFRFNMDNQPVSAKGLRIPQDAVSLVTGLSEKLATTEPHLTYDFLTEFFIGWEKSHTHQRALNIRYISPWLSNLYTHVYMGTDETERRRDRMIEIAKKMITMTLSEPRLYTSFQQNVWSIIGKDEALLDIFLEELFQMAFKLGPMSESVETIGSICASFESVTIRSRVIMRLRKTVTRTSSKASSNLTDNAVWNEICVLLRICLAISFDSRVQAQLFLPELFHVITLVVNHGNMLIKSTVHSLLVNSVHSIATSFPLADENVQKLKDLLASLSEPKMYLLFGLNRPELADGAEDRDEALSTWNTMEQLTKTMLEIIQVAAPTTDMANIWRARWMSLLATTAFQTNPPIQPRAFAVMGCLALDEVDDDLLYQVLVVLKTSLARLAKNHDEELLISVINCLSKMMSHVKKESRYQFQFFWMAISLLRLSSPNVFISAAGLLESVLRRLSSLHFFVNDAMIPILMQGRIGCEEPLDLLDKLYGVRFDPENFHFAVAATLTKGLQSPATKTAAIQTLTSFVEIGMANAVGSGEESLYGMHIPLPPYLSMIISRAKHSSEIKQLMWLVGLPLEDLEIRDYPALDVMSERNALLTGILALIDFKSGEEEMQKHAVHFFIHMAKLRPEAFVLL
ncbi:hypothetical protein EX30DRAFT_254963 [Ascodesmis nigricans]|uniref:Ras-GAP domain-containing protein n=1 Tax=Ascodesmis nigricans TaxID=341454 RepID=A0A4S2MYC1_9PEZI|nr:hypothetical protein EX30DRAFT_254963 [Ascodesmis nigricans]